jgi:hypothetical protein
MDIVEGKMSSSRTAETVQRKINLEQLFSGVQYIGQVMPTITPKRS